MFFPGVPVCAVCYVLCAALRVSRCGEHGDRCCGVREKVWLCSQRPATFQTHTAQRTRGSSHTLTRPSRRRGRRGADRCRRATPARGGEQRSAQHPERKVLLFITSVRCCIQQHGSMAAWQHDSSDKVAACVAVPLDDDRTEVPEVFDKLDGVRFLLAHVLLEWLLGRRRCGKANLDKFGERERRIPCV